MLNRREIPMKYRIAVALVVLLLGSVASLVNAAESKAIQTMAGILVHLQHYPTDADKQSLKQITEDKSATSKFGESSSAPPARPNAEDRCAHPPHVAFAGRRSTQDH